MQEGPLGLVAVSPASHQGRDGTVLSPAHSPAHGARHSQASGPNSKRSQRTKDNKPLVTMILTANSEP